MFLEKSCCFSVFSSKCGDSVVLGFGFYLGSSPGDLAQKAKAAGLAVARGGPGLDDLGASVGRGWRKWEVDDGFAFWLIFVFLAFLFWAF